MIICGKLILPFTPTTAVELPNDRVLLLKATFNAANIRWRGLHKESAPNCQEVERPFHASDTVAQVWSSDESEASEAVRTLGEVGRELYHSAPPVDGVVEQARWIFPLHCVPQSKSSYLYILINDVNPSSANVAIPESGWLCF